MRIALPIALAAIVVAVSAPQAAVAAPTFGALTLHSLGVERETDATYRFAGANVAGFFLAEPPERAAAQAARLRRALEHGLGLDASRVPIHLMSPNALIETYRAIGANVRTGWRVEGFEYRGHVFARVGLQFAADETLIHELLHALSGDFNTEAHVRGWTNLMEGLTEWFSEDLMARELPGEPDKNRAYVAYTELAAQLVALVGEPRMRQLMFGRERHRLATLEALIDARCGRRALRSAAMALENNDFAKALALIERAR